MISLFINDYVRNIWYNIICVVIIAGTLFVSTIFISNISAQTNMYRLLSPYLNENSIMMGNRFWFDDSELIKVEDSLMTKELFFNCEKVVPGSYFGVYSEEVMKLLPPRITEGRNIGKAGGKELEILASAEGYKVGDVISIELYSGEDSVFVDARIVGIIADGQKVFVGNNKTYSGMDYDDMYLTYSSEQLREALFITTEEQLNKITVPVDYLNRCCIYKMQEDITRDEFNGNLKKVTDYELEMISATTNSMYPSVSEMIENMEAKTEQVIYKYLPLTIGLTVMVVVCVIGIITVKNAKSMRYYSVMHITGMNLKNTIFMSGAEMLLNIILATIICVSIVIIQNRIEIFGTINCVLNTAQIVTMVIISLVIVVLTMIMTGATLKEKTIVEILRDTTY